jgi:hypothetical protein
MNVVGLHLSFFDCADSGRSVEWTEESSPHVADAGDVPGPSTGRRRRRAVAKRRVSGAEGARLCVSGTGRQELLSLPAAVNTGEGELRSLFAGEELRIMLFNYREMGIILKVEPM